jgi:hypothetical protein
MIVKKILGVFGPTVIVLVTAAYVCRLTFSNFLIFMSILMGILVALVIYDNRRKNPT